MTPLMVKSPLVLTTSVLPVPSAVLPLCMPLPEISRFVLLARLRAPVPLRDGKLVLPVRLMLSVPLLTIAPPTLPVLPPVPRVRVPALMVVVPVCAALPARTRLPAPDFVKVALAFCAARPWVMVTEVGLTRLATWMFAPAPAKVIKPPSVWVPEFMRNAPVPAAPLPVITKALLID